MNFFTRKHSAVKEALSTPAGEFLLGMLLDVGGLYKSSFSSDPYIMAFNEGRRSIALEIIKQLDLREDEVREYLRAYKTEQYASADETYGVS